MTAPYLEDFSDGTGGWGGWRRQGENVPLTIEDGALVIQGPWGIDAYHAPPGGGYLALLAYLHTSDEHLPDHMRPNHFVERGHSTDLRGAQLTVRIRGELALRGAEVVLLVQAAVEGTISNWVLIGQPLRIGPEWSVQTLRLDVDPAQWRCLGTRHDITDYGYAPLDAVLADANVDLIFVLYPLTVVPLSPSDDIHRLRPQVDYPVDERYLPDGQVEISLVRIDYPEGTP